MQDFEGLSLCDYRSEQVTIHVRASMTDGALTVAGHDLGAVTEEIWGDTDYEYWYMFTPEETEKLLWAIDGLEDPQGALLREFSGESGCRALQELCENRGIEYEFSSYC